MISVRRRCEFIRTMRMNLLLPLPNLFLSYSLPSMALDGRFQAGMTAVFKYDKELDYSF